MPPMTFLRILVLLTLPLHALELAPPFRDHAILQREMKVPVWGWSDPETTVTVTFAGQSKEAVAGPDGQWRVDLDPLSASSEPAELTIAESNGQSVTLKDILVGEVWLASGQSNMQWVASKCDTGRVLQKQIAERVADGKEKAPIIREAKITNYFAALHPVEHAEAEWSSDQEEFSAIAFSFAYEIHRTLKVPVGILNCSFSQTAIQAWTPREGFAGGTSDYTRAIHQKVLESDPTTPEHKDAWGRFYRQIEDTLAANKGRIAAGQPALPVSTKTPGNLSGNRDATWLFNARLHPMIPFAIRGAIWNQGYANSGEGLTYYDNLHSLIRGWRLLWKKPELPVYFHQFYCPGQKGEWDHTPSIDPTAEMRLGTWMARDIPHTGMASQIDITGAIHYANKTLPGQRLALHALKNQYGQKIETDGPMYRYYSVKGDLVLIEFNHAKGLCIAETGTNSKDRLAVPTVIPDGLSQVKCLFVADAERVWHPAEIVAIKGDEVIVRAPGVKNPRGVSYGTGGIGNEPNLYNSALLPATPFIAYDNKLVFSKDWPDETLRVVDQEVDPDSVGLLNEYRKMPLLSTQFRDGAVLQADKPLVIWGSAVHDWGYEAKGQAVIKFSFAGIEKTIPVTPGMSEWQVTLPAMEASAEPKTLKVRFEIDGELAHERIAEDLVLGDVFYLAASGPSDRFAIAKKSSAPVRMMTRKAKRYRFSKPSRFSVCVSTTPENRFASEWTEAIGLPAALGHRLSQQSGRPVGIIFMQTPTSEDVSIASWIHPEDLKLAPSLMDDYRDLAAVRPGNPFYDANARRYLKAWQTYWNEYVPELIHTGRVPDELPWGTYPVLDGTVTSTASEVYHVMTESFTPATLRGIVFLTSETMEAKAGEHFSEQRTALVRSWQSRFGLGSPEPLIRPAQMVANPETSESALDELAADLLASAQKN